MKGKPFIGPLKIGVATVIIVLAVLSPVYSELDPPDTAVDSGGAPVSTMRTLAEVEPRTPILSLPITITTPGSYYLTGNLTGTTVNGDGIIIDTNEVSIDLNGYTLDGSTEANDDGIYVLGNQQNIYIHNGTVSGWGGDGINALNADNSIFENLSISNNGGDGLVTDFGCIIIDCTANANGIDGLEGDDGTLIKNSTAFENMDNGIQTSDGCLVLDSTSYKNENDGIDIAAGSIVRRCVARENGIFGFDLALSTSAIACTASLNGWDDPKDPNDPDPANWPTSANGFDIASACIVRDCIATENKANGFRSFANAWITGNTAHGNGVAGIRASSTDSHVEGNQCTNNGQKGIYATSAGSLIFGNRASGNKSSGNNFDLDPNTTYGPVVNTGNMDMAGVANANHHMANFEY